MPRKREIAKKSKTVISENLKNYLLTGELTKGDAEVFLVSDNPPQKRAIWDAVKAEILKDWIKENPCTRPYMFWLLVGELRQIVSGSGGWRPGMGIDSEGLPAYWQLHFNKKNPPVFESQAAFLQRNGLLTKAEKEFLKKHPALLEPETIEFNEE
jgi:hypothetical protein